MIVVLVGMIVVKLSQGLWSYQQNLRLFWRLWTQIKLKIIKEQAKIIMLKFYDDIEESYIDIEKN